MQDEITKSHLPVKPTKKHSPSVWLIALAVWSPILLLGLAYGIAYVVFYYQANSLESRYQANLAKCQAQIATDNTKTTFSKDGMEVCQTLNTSVSPGFLGLPTYMVDGNPSNYTAE